MTRRRKPEGDVLSLNGATTLPPADHPAETPVPETNGAADGPPPGDDGKTAPAGEGRGPAFKVGPVPVSMTEAVSVAVWGNTYTDRRSGATFTVYSVTVECRYRTGDGDWRSGKSFRGSAVPVLVWALEKAHAWILNQRDPSNTPF